MFSEVFFRADKRAQRERTGKTRVFIDTFGTEGDGDVKEGYEEKRMRMMKWKARRTELERRNPFLDDTPDVGSFDSAQTDAAFQPLTFNVALNQDSALSYPTFFPPADAAQVDAVPAYAASSNVFQGSSAAYAASSNAFRGSTAAFGSSSSAGQASVASFPSFFDATEARENPYPIPFTALHQQADTAVQSNPIAVDYSGIPEDEKMILTGDDEQVDVVVAEVTANAPINPKAMVVDDCKESQTMGTNSLPNCSREAQSLNSNKKEDDDIYMQ